MQRVLSLPRNVDGVTQDARCFLRRVESARILRFHEVHEELARYCGGEAARAERGLIGPEQIEWLDRVRDDLDNYRGALTWRATRTQKYFRSRGD